ncbi:hypothetical protein [Breznakia pachnodae]|uniref:Uncharacterized protein n=1 Tax=Breznakia pachnodae TaxID=265178 RepID=A0ABU0E6L4_9FIRM|nr:hypothetical protein [Breznakia pachnodae]MDQ0362547.1 hypothetical protein [Breznakia pachnodae]
MNHNQKVHYGLQLTGVMKKSLKKTSNDEFDLGQFNLLKMNLINCAAGNISVKSLQDILDMLLEIQSTHLIEKRKNPTYKEVRDSLRWMQLTGYKRLRKELKD